jgi:hypothetical protein
MSNNFITCNHTNSKVPYNIKIGIDPQLIILIEKEWGDAKSKIFQELLHNHPDISNDNDLFIEKIKEYGLTDFHWRWFDKALQLNTNEYEWFFIIANGSVQAVCLIYHPKASRIDGADIFYIDYISSAYWNRSRPGYIKKYSSPGKILIRYTIDHAINKLGYRPGFSLHALPTAEDYYRHLNMKEFNADPSKENLVYFEAPADVAVRLAEGDI